MNRTIITLIATALAVQGVALLCSSIVLTKRINNVEPEVIEKHDTIYIEIPNEWECMVSALVRVESNGKCDAVNATTGATGILQIMPIYVAEANRISHKGFTLEDRLDPSKSREMFEIVQSHHNPKRDIEKAIRSHNPTAGDWYYNRVIKAMEDIRNEQLLQSKG